MTTPETSTPSRGGYPSESFDIHRFPSMPVIAEPEKIPDHIFGELLKHSKGMQRVLALGCPIETTPLLAIVHPLPDYAGNFDIAKPDGFRKRLVPAELCQSLNQSPSSPDDFAANFIAGRYPAMIFFKPEGSAGGNGVIKIVREEDQITVTTRNPANRHLPSQSYLLGYARLHPDISLSEQPDNPQLILRIPLSDHSRAVAILSDVCCCAMTTVFTHKPGNPGFAYTDLNSGLAEAAQDFLKVDGRVIEGRYFLIYAQGRLSLSNSQGPKGEAYPSYMKRGLDQDFVNLGEIHATWPGMHQSLITEKNLDCSSADFDCAMQRLLYRQAGQAIANLCNLAEEPDEFLHALEAVGLIVDLAWHDKETIEVSAESDGSLIQIPRPFMVEMDVRLKFKDTVLAAPE